MPTAIELMDSRKFMKQFEEMVQLCLNDEGVVDIDEKKVAPYLQVVLDAAGPQVNQNSYIPVNLQPKETTKIVPDARRLIGKKNLTTAEIDEAILSPDVELKLKRKRRTKAEMQAIKEALPALKRRAKFDTDSASDKQLAAEIDRLKASQPTREQCIQKAVESVIKPIYNQTAPAWDGFRHFVVNMDRPDGSTLSGNGDLWKAALKTAGIQFSKLEMGSKGMQNRQLDIMIM